MDEIIRQDVMQVIKLRLQSKITWQLASTSAIQGIKPSVDSHFDYFPSFYVIILLDFT